MEEKSKMNTHKKYLYKEYSLDDLLGMLRSIGLSHPNLVLLLKEHHEKIQTLEKGQQLIAQMRLSEIIYKYIYEHKKDIICSGVISLLEQTYKGASFQFLKEHKLISYFILNQPHKLLENVRDYNLIKLSVLIENIRKKIISDYLILASYINKTLVESDSEEIIVENIIDGFLQEYTHPLMQRINILKQVLEVMEPKPNNVSKYEYMTNELVDKKTKMAKSDPIIYTDADALYKYLEQSLPNIFQSRKDIENKNKKKNKE